MKITTKQFRERYNIARSTEAKLRKDAKLPYNKINGHIIYDQKETDALALQGKLGAKALIAVNNILNTPNPKA